MPVSAACKCDKMPRFHTLTLTLTLTVPLVPLVLLLRQEKHSNSLQRSPIEANVSIKLIRTASANSLLGHKNSGPPTQGCARKSTAILSDGAKLRPM